MVSYVLLQQSKPLTEKLTQSSHVRVKPATTAPFSILFFMLNPCYLFHLLYLPFQTKNTI